MIGTQLSSAKPESQSTHRVITFRQWWTANEKRRPDPSQAWPPPVTHWAGRLTVTWHADCITCRRSLGTWKTQASADRARRRHIKEHS